MVACLQTNDLILSFWLKKFYKYFEKIIYVLNNVYSIILITVLVADYDNIALNSKVIESKYLL